MERADVAGKSSYLRPVSGRLPAELRIGYVPGVFDLFHIGHLNVLRRATELCDFLVAGVVTDEACRKSKGVDPVVPLAERLAIVSACRYVDEAVVEDTNHKIEMWERIGFHVIIKGDDWKGTDRGDKLEQDLATVGVEVAYLPYTEQTSSSMLRRVLERELIGHLGGSTARVQGQASNG